MRELFEELIKEVATGRVEFNGGYYNVGFNTNIMKDGEVLSIYGEENSKYLVPTLQINNYNTFMYYLYEYLLKAEDFYEEEIGTNYNAFSDKDISKLLMSLVWANATSCDFNNPVEYLQRRINLLDDISLRGIPNTILSERIDAFDDSSIEYSIKKHIYI